jgi:phage shock protein E
MKSLIIALIVLCLFIGLNGCGGAPAKRTDSGVPNVPTGIKAVPPAEALVSVSKAYSQFVDLRTPEEYASGHPARSINIPMDKLATKLDILEKSEPVYLICQSGELSKNAANLLKDAGFNNVIYVEGGTTAWQAAGLPMETRPPHNVPTPRGETR